MSNPLDPSLWRISTAQALTQGSDESRAIGTAWLFGESTPAPTPAPAPAQSVDGELVTFAALFVETAQEQDEFMTLEPTPLSRALEMIRTGELNDAKSALALLYAAGFRLSQ